MIALVRSTPEGFQPSGPGQSESRIRSQSHVLLYWVMDTASRTCKRPSSRGQGNSPKIAGFPSEQACASCLSRADGWAAIGVEALQLTAPPFRATNDGSARSAPVRASESLRKTRPDELDRVMLRFSHSPSSAWAQQLPCVSAAQQVGLPVSASGCDSADAGSQRCA